MFIEYIDGNSILHQLDVRTKSLGFLIVLLSAFLYSNPIHNMIILGSCIILALVIQLPFRHLSKMFKPLLPILFMIILFASISYGPTSFDQGYSKLVLFSIGGGEYIKCTLGGILFGVSLSLRIVTMVIASTIFTLTTPIDELLHLLQKMKVSYKIGFIFTTGLRFIPTMEKKANQIIEAQRSRCAQFHTGNMIQRIRAYIPVMIPMIVESLRMSENLAMAMVNRGFGATKKWTILTELRPGWKDYFITLILVLLAIAIIYTRIMGFGKL